MRKQHLAFLGLLAGLLGPVATAGATNFSFGEILATDQIASIIVAPGVENLNVTFDSSSDNLLIEGFVSTINFTNRSSISVNPGDVQFSSSVDITTGPDFIPPVNPITLTAELMNGAADFSMIDLVGTGGGPILMFTGDYFGPLDMSLTGVGGVVRGELSAEFNSNMFMAGDPDFLDAFGRFGSLDAVLAIGTGNLCGTVASCTLGTSGVATGLVDWDANPVITIQAVPEPATAFLVGAGLILLATRRRSPVV